METGNWFLTKEEYDAGEKERLDVAGLAIGGIYALICKVRPKRNGSYVGIGTFTRINEVMPLPKELTRVQLSFLDADFTEIHKSRGGLCFKDDLLQVPTGLFGRQKFSYSSGYFADAPNPLGDELRAYDELDTPSTSNRASDCVLVVAGK